MLEINNVRLISLYNKTKDILQSLVQETKAKLLPEEEGVDQDLQMLYLVQLAKEEWLEAKKFFGEVSEPDLVDHAIYRIEAAEKKFVYLLKLAQGEGLSSTHIHFK